MQSEYYAPVELPEEELEIEDDFCFSGDSMLYSSSSSGSYQIKTSGTISYGAWSAADDAWLDSRSYSARTFSAKPNANGDIILANVQASTSEVGVMKVGIPYSGGCIVTVVSPDAYDYTSGTVINISGSLTNYLVAANNGTYSDFEAVYWPDTCSVYLGDLLIGTVDTVQGMAAFSLEKELTKDCSGLSFQFGYSQGYRHAENSKAMQAYYQLTMVLLDSVSIGTTKEPEYTGLLSGIIEWLKGILNSITNLPGLIVSGISELFIPSQEDITGIKTQYQTLLENKFGAVYQLFAWVGTTFENMVDVFTSGSSGAVTNMSFTVVSPEGTWSNGVVTLVASPSDGKVTLQSVPMYFAAGTYKNSFTLSGFSVVSLIYYNLDDSSIVTYPSGGVFTVSTAGNYYLKAVISKSSVPLTFNFGAKVTSQGSSGEGLSDYEFVFPGLSVPYQGQYLTILGETPVSLDNAAMDILRSALGTIVCFVAVIGVANVMRRMIIAILSGKSWFEFLHGGEGE